MEAVTTLKRQISFTRPRYILVAGFACLVVFALFYLVVPGWATQTEEVNNQVDMPPFQMVRTVSDASGTGDFLLIWEGQDAWKEALIANDLEVPKDFPESDDVFRDIGRFYEVRDGQIRYSEFGHVTILDAGANIQVPGIWFADLDWLMGRYRDANVTETSDEVILEVTNQLSTSVWVLDRATGIPLEYREIVDGQVVVDSRATSVVLLSGEVIR